jgi:hypothetical protein
MGFHLEDDMVKLIQECFVKHDKHLVLADSGGAKSVPGEKEIRRKVKKSCKRLQRMLQELLEFKHAEQTSSDRHQGYGWSSEIIRERFCAAINAEIELTYKALL